MEAVDDDMPDRLTPEEQSERLRSAMHAGLNDDARTLIVREEALA